MNNAYETLKEFFEKRGNIIESFSTEKTSWFITYSSAERGYATVVTNMGHEIVFTIAFAHIPVSFYFTECEIEDNNRLVFKRNDETIGAINLIY